MRNNAKTKKWLFADNYYCFRNSLRSNFYIVILESKIILVVTGLYLLNQVVLKKYFGSFFQNYFNDFLAGIMITAVINLIIVVGGKSQSQIRKLWNTIFTMTVIGSFWEFVTPLYKENSVTDGYDLVAYMGGGVIYYAVQNAKNYRNVFDKYLRKF